MLLFDLASRSRLSSSVTANPKTRVDTTGNTTVASLSAWEALMSVWPPSSSTSL